MKREMTGLETLLLESLKRATNMAVDWVKAEKAAASIASTEKETRWAEALASNFKKFTDRQIALASNWDQHVRDAVDTLQARAPLYINAEAFAVDEMVALRAKLSDALDRTKIAEEEADRDLKDMRRFQGMVIKLTGERNEAIELAEKAQTGYERLMKSSERTITELTKIRNDIAELRGLFTIAKGDKA